MRGFTEFIQFCLPYGLVLLSSCGIFSSKESKLYVNDYYHPKDILGIYKVCQDLNDCRIRIVLTFKNREGLTKNGFSELQVWNSKAAEKYYWPEEPAEIKSVPESFIKLNTVQRKLKKLEILLQKSGVILDFSELFTEKQEVRIPFEEPVNSGLKSVSVSLKKDFLIFRYEDGSELYYNNSYQSETNRFFEYKSQNKKADSGPGYESVKMERINFRKSLLLNLNDHLFLVSADDTEFHSVRAVSIPPLKVLKFRTPSESDDSVRDSADPRHLDLSFLYPAALLFKISKAVK